MPPPPKASKPSEDESTSAAADTRSRSGPRGEGAASGPPAAPPPASDAIVGSGEFRSSADRRTGLISGIQSFGIKRVTYANVKGIGIFEGDISLGPIAKLDKMKAAAD